MEFPTQTPETSQSEKFSQKNEILENQTKNIAREKADKGYGKFSSSSVRKFLGMGMLVGASLLAVGCGKESSPSGAKESSSGSDTKQVDDRFEKASQRIDKKLEEGRGVKEAAEKAGSKGDTVHYTKEKGKITEINGQKVPETRISPDVDEFLK